MTQTTATDSTWIRLGAGMQRAAALRLGAGMHPSAATRIGAGMHPVSRVRLATATHPAPAAQMDAGRQPTQAHRPVGTAPVTRFTLVPGCVADAGRVRLGAGMQRI